MTQYNLTLSPSELETIETLMAHTIERLDSMITDTNEVLDGPLTDKEYSLYVRCLANMTRDTANMRSILSRVELFHGQ